MRTFRSKLYAFEDGKSVTDRRSTRILASKLDDLSEALLNGLAEEPRVRWQLITDGVVIR